MSTSFKVRRVALIALCASAAYFFTACASMDDQERAKAQEAPGPALSVLERKLLDITKEQEELFERMGKAQISEDDFERRILVIASRYDELVSANPNNVDLLIIYGKFLRRINQNDRAHVMFSHADQLQDDIAVLKQQIGNYLAETGQYSEALAYYVCAQELEPETAVYHYGIGELLATFRDRFKEDLVYSDDMLDRGIMSAFGKAVELDPANKDFAFRMGEAFYDLAKPDWDRADAYWLEVSQRGDLTKFEKDVVRLHRARVLCEKGQRKDALKLLRDDVEPFLAATRMRLLKRITDEDAAAQAAMQEASDAAAPAGEGADNAEAPLWGDTGVMEEAAQ